MRYSRDHQPLAGTSKVDEMTQNVSEAKPSTAAPTATTSVVESDIGLQDGGIAVSQPSGIRGMVDGVFKDK
jgi:hypothetical protein